MCTAAHIHWLAHKDLTARYIQIMKLKNIKYVSQPVGYNYLSMLNFQRLKTRLKFVKPQELVAKRTSPVSDLQYAAQRKGWGIVLRNLKLVATLK